MVRWGMKWYFTVVGQARWRVHTPGDFIVLPHWDTRPPPPWPTISLSALSWHWTNHSLPYPNNAEHQDRKWQVSILKSSLDQILNSRAPNSNELSSDSQISQNGRGERSTATTQPAKHVGPMWDRYGLEYGTHMVYLYGAHMSFANGFHMGPIWAAHIGPHMGPIWVPCGLYVGPIWDLYGACIFHYYIHVNQMS